MSQKNYTKIGKLAVVDPNGCGQSMVPIEDLSISVELEVYRRGDDMNPIKVNSSNSIKISFINPNKTEKSYLNTHYTEIGRKYGESHPEEDLLGIESIDISFDTSYAPVVKIRFKDIRGKLFERGNSSPYGFLFEMPYPIFYLTIKGYYDQPVQYALHMLKFNGTFDNETGSFIIDCDFIGYTYAFLADILMSYLKAIPFTVEGRKIIGGDFKTFADLNLSIKELDKIIETFKGEDTQLKAVSSANGISVKLDEIITSIESLRDSYLENSSAISISNGPVFILKLGVNKIDRFDDLKKELSVLNTRYNESVVKIIDDYNETIKVISGGNKYVLSAKDFQINEDNVNNSGLGVYYEILNTDYTEIASSWESYNSGIYPEKNGKTASKDYVKRYNNLNEDNYIDFLDALNTIPPQFEADGITKTPIYIGVYDFKNVVNQIRVMAAGITKDVDYNTIAIMSKFSKLIQDSIENSNGQLIDVTIGRLFEILTSHVDLFINSIKNVGADALKNINNSNRNALDINPGGKHPFPNYIEKNTDPTVNREEVIWIGKKAPNIPEVIFIEDLYKSIIKSAKQDIEDAKNIEENKTLWYPVNPKETSLYDNSLKNPWELIGDDLGVEYVYKLMIQRMIIFLGYSNKGVTDDEAIMMGKIEANESFNHIKNSQVITALRDEMKKYGSSDTYGFFKNIARDYLKKNNLFFFVDGDDRYKIGYTHETATLDNYDPSDYTWLPLAQGKDALLGELTPILFDSSSNFLSNIPSSNFIKIIRSDTYVGGNTYPNYEVTGDLFGGKYGTKEYVESPLLTFYDDGRDILRRNKKQIKDLTDEDVKYDTFIFNNITKGYSYNEKLIPLKIAPLDNLRSKSNLYTQIKAGDTLYNFDSVFYSGGEAYSLFGSDFYNSQDNDFAKAFLFLHTIPFNGIVRDTVLTELLTPKVLELFNTYAGFVEVPYSWIIFIGSLLYRMEQSIDVIKYKDDKVGPLVSGYESNTPLKLDDFLLNQTGSLLLRHITTTIKVDNIIKELPEKVKEIFIKEFTDWVANGFLELKNNLQIFNDNTSKEDMFTIWFGQTGTVFKNYNSLSALNQNIVTNYKIISPFGKNNKVDTLPKIKKGGNGSPINFYLELNDNGDGTILLRKFLNETRVILNSTYGIWSETKFDDGDITVNKESVIKYLESFFTTFKGLSEKTTVDNTDSINQTLFNTTQIDDVKLSLYKNVKAIYDKWIVGVDNLNPDANKNIITNNLFNHFKFIDRAHNDISNKIKLSPHGFIDYLISAQNISFHTFIARVLADNNFDFIPLPTYVNYTNAEAVSNVFKPIRYNNMQPASGPQFICMYIGERSNKLDLKSNDNNEDKKGDSFIIKTHYTKDCVLTNDDYSQAPSDLIDDTTDANKIPYFLVKYGDQNQSIFKNISLNQSEFTETNEGLIIMDNIANTNKNGSIGQNLFDIYNNRSYSAEIEMLGCAQIQPFMYFQLDNIPMFSGAYTVIKTSHNITANKMTTKFKGVRIRKVGTKLVDDITIFYNLIGKPEDISSGGADLSNLSSAPTTQGTQGTQVKDGFTPTNHWSAVFVNYVVNKTVEFPKKSAHLDYLDEVINNPKYKSLGWEVFLNTDSVITKADFKVGDIIIKSRTGGSHGDIVVDISNGVITTIGGNLGDTVQKSTLVFNGPWIAIIRPKPDWVSGIVNIANEEDTFWGGKLETLANSTSEEGTKIFNRLSDYWKTVKVKLYRDI